MRSEHPAQSPEPALANDPLKAYRSRGSASAVELRAVRPELRPHAKAPEPLDHRQLRRLLGSVVSPVDKRDLVLIGQLAEGIELRPKEGVLRSSGRVPRHV